MITDEQIQKSSDQPFLTGTSCEGKEFNVFMNYEQKEFYKAGASWMQEQKDAEFMKLIEEEVAEIEEKMENETYIRRDALYSEQIRDIFLLTKYESQKQVLSDLLDKLKTK